MIKILSNDDYMTLYICSHDTNEGRTFGYEFHITEVIEEPRLRPPPPKIHLIHSVPNCTYETALLALDAALDFAVKNRLQIFCDEINPCEIHNHSVINDDGCVIDGEISVVEQLNSFEKQQISYTKC